MSTTLSSLLVGLVVAAGLAALLLYGRDRLAKAQGKAVAQIQARFFAILQFRSTLERCIPGVLTKEGRRTVMQLGLRHRKSASCRRNSRPFFGANLGYRTAHKAPPTCHSGSR